MHLIDTSRDAHPIEADYVELLRTDGLSVGSYVIPIGADDPQQPHTEDEIYVCLAGHAALAGARARLPIRPGTVAFVPAGEEHRFVDVTDELHVLVVFGPAEHRNKGIA